MHSLIVSPSTSSALLALSCIFRERLRTPIGLWDICGLGRVNSPLVSDPSSPTTPYLRTYVQRFYSTNRKGSSDKEKPSDMGDEEYFYKTFTNPHLYQTTSLQATSGVMDRTK